MQYLFFFKQKTAYEMRISDWSSDVCSSDLVGGSGNVAVEHIEPDKEVLEFGDHRGVELRQALCRDHRGNAALAASRAEIGQRGDADPARFRVARGTGMVGGEQVTFVDANEDGVRSEEHTSELQSLMRITDAVFC